MFTIVVAKEPGSIPNKKPHPKFTFFNSVLSSETTEIESSKSCLHNATLQGTVRFNITICKHNQCGT